LRNSIHFAVCAAALSSMLTCSASAWQSPVQTKAMQQYGKTAPYVDLPVAQMKKSIRELNGIKPDDTPIQLELILEKTGEAIGLQLPRVPNLTSRGIPVPVSPMRISTPVGRRPVSTVILPFFSFPSLTRRSCGRGGASRAEVRSQWSSRFFCILSRSA
jgi:hypothetical protein